MGYESVHSSAAEGDDQELRRCLEGLDVDRDGIFDRADPEPRIPVGATPGAHGRYNRPVAAGSRGSCGDTPLHKAAAAGQATCVAYIMSLAATGLPVPHGVSEETGIGDHRGQMPRTNPAPWEATVVDDFYRHHPIAPTDDVRGLLSAQNDAGNSPLPGVPVLLDS